MAEKQARAAEKQSEGERGAQIEGRVRRERGKGVTGTEEEKAKKEEEEGKRELNYVLISRPFRSARRATRYAEYPAQFTF